MFESHVGRPALTGLASIPFKDFSTHTIGVRPAAQTQPLVLGIGTCIYKFHL